MLNMTVKKFADHFIPSDGKIRVIHNMDVVFDGTLDELYYSGADVLNLIVAMVGAVDDKVCLSCRRTERGEN